MDLYIALSIVEKLTNSYQCCKVKGDTRCEWNRSRAPLFFICFMNIYLSIQMFAEYTNVFRTVNNRSQAQPLQNYLYALEDRFNI